MLNTKIERPKLLLFLMLFIVPITGAGTDVYTPSLPHIVTYFATTAALTRYTIVVYLLGYGLSLTTYGMVSDSIGRRKVSIFALFLFTIASLLAANAPNMSVLLVLRFLQGVAVGGTSITTKAMISDCFTGQLLRRYAVYNNGAWAVGIIVSPVIGGYLQAYFSWHAAFYFLTIYGLTGLLLIYYLLPETIQKKQPISFTNAIHNYKTILLHPIFIGSALILTLFYSLLITFNVLAPFIVQDLLHRSSIEYGHYALLMGLAWLLGNISSRHLMEKMQYNTLMLSCLVISIVTASIMFILSYVVLLNLPIVLIGSFLVVYITGILFPPGFSRCITLFPHMGGSANAVMISFYIIGASLISSIASLITLHNQIPLAFIYTLLLCICLLVYITLLRQETSIKTSETH